MIIAVTEETYKNIVENSDKPVLLDVWAPWCGPCRAVEPVVKELDAAFGDTIVVAKLNADDAPDLTAKLGIQGIPTVRVIQNGRTRFETVGLGGLTRLAAEIGQALQEGAAK